MAKIELRTCENCKKETEHTWVRDTDSDPDEPQFWLCCTICGREYHEFCELSCSTNNSPDAFWWINREVGP